jgi:hypothetical protein
MVSGLCHSYNVNKYGCREDSYLSSVESLLSRSCRFSMVRIRKKYRIVTREKPEEQT